MPWITDSLASAISAPSRARSAQSAHSLTALPATFTTAGWADNNTPIDGWVDRVQALPGGSATVTVAGSQVTITITWTDAKGGAGGTTHNYTTATLIAKNT